jgi:pimeloyl-ACP methyl ester carboxylesterase
MKVFAPSGYQIKRVVVRYHQSMPEMLIKLATLTFGDLCTWVHDGANILIATAQQFATVSYVVVGDSLGGFISLVAAQRDRRITHCILLSCSGDFCDAMNEKGGFRTRSQPRSSAMPSFQPHPLREKIGDPPEERIYAPQ